VAALAALRAYPDVFTARPVTHYSAGTLIEKLPLGALSNKLNAWLKTVSALFPGECLLCGYAPAGPDNLCAACREALPIIDTACPVCAEPLPVATHCQRCRAKPPTYSRTVAPLHYTAEVRYMVLQLKFSARLDAGLSLAMLLVRHLQVEGYGGAERLLPVPLHPRRFRSRGFNQAREIALVVSRQSGIPILANAVRRTRHTAAQSSLGDRQDRAENIRGAFEVQHGAGLSGRRIAIIDDVVTTGVTASGLATALRAAGARDVQVWACARAAESSI